MRFMYSNELKLVYSHRNGEYLEAEKISKLLFTTKKRFSNSKKKSSKFKTKNKCFLISHGISNLYINNSYKRIIVVLKMRSCTFVYHQLISKITALFTILLPTWLFRFVYCINNKIMRQFCQQTDSSKYMINNDES